MGNLLEYGLYAIVFIAVILLVEGLWRLLNGAIGEGRIIKRRLDKARAPATAVEPGQPSRRPDVLSAIIAARLPKLGKVLDRAQLPLGPTQLLIIALGLFLLFELGLSAIGAPRVLAVVAGLAFGGGVPWLLVTTLMARRRRRFLDQLPQAVDLIARSLQAGHPVATAMSVVAERMPAPLGPEFRTVIEEMTYGLSRDAALQNMLQRFPVAELRMFVACLEVTRESGGNLAEVFLKLAEAIRAKQQFRQKVTALSAEGRMSFWVVSGLPFVVGAALMLLRPRYFLDVAGDPLFWPMISGGPVLLLIGATIIWRMVNVKL